MSLTTFLSPSSPSIILDAPTAALACRQYSGARLLHENPPMAMRSTPRRRAELVRLASDAKKQGKDKEHNADVATRAATLFFGDAGNNGGATVAWTCVEDSIVAAQSTGNSQCTNHAAQTSGSLVGTSGSVSVTLTSGPSGTASFSCTNAVTSQTRFHGPSHHLRVPQRALNSSTAVKDEVTETITMNAKAGKHCYLNYNTRSCYDPVKGKQKLLKRPKSTQRLSVQLDGRLHAWEEDEALLRGSHRMRTAPTDAKSFQVETHAKAGKKSIQAQLVRRSRSFSAYMYGMEDELFDSDSTQTPFYSYLN
ncbi:hypothetical protein DFH08DRAFT_977423 [Mycena albidolilacea]|uniref:Uncharacterized protein n=1 Tax=Mycena albidolilacea TaxID=1033008 RepID=A0AAD6Z0Q0_9AGAR|nr:hypothetical protein DFH08DRAFT_977423 [Mycena albidolilacea]